MAERLVADMTGKWKPQEYVDQYERDVMKLVQRKIKAGEVHALDDAPEPKKASARGEIIDLMPLLRKSVEAAQSRGKHRLKVVRGGKKRSRPATRRRSA